MSLKDKILTAQERILSAYAIHGEHIFSGHSGGKDSSTILSLALGVIPDLKVIHNVKKISHPNQTDPIGKTDVDIRTLEFLYSYPTTQVEELILVNTNDMEGYIKKKGLTCQIDGSRIEEFTREDKSNMFILNGKEVSRENMEPYIEDGLFGLSFCYPILDWTAEDVFDYHRMMNIPLSDEYEDDAEWLMYATEVQNG